ncbi:MAG TPA: hypothetical protein VJG83_02095 [archaeon]|nr:hypothetical protein [archaeon]
MDYEKVSLLCRRGIDVIFRGVGSAQRKIKGEKPIANLLYYPAAQTKAQASDLLNRASWYFPESKFSAPKIIVPLSQKISKAKIADFTAPLPQQNFIGTNPNVSTAQEKELAHLLPKADAILLWQAKELFSIPNWFLNLDKIWIVDPSYLLVTESRNYIWLYNATVGRAALNSLLEKSKSNFQKLITQIKKSKKAYLCGTGPSIAAAKDFDFSDGFGIVANTIINDPKIMGRIKPRAIVFGDFVYHVGPSRYASKFREKMRQECREMFAIARFDVVPLMVARYPSLEDRIVGIPIKILGGPNIVSPQNYYVTLTNNSLTGWMLPVASSGADEMYIIGCDGRKKGDRMYWGHAKTTHYDDLTQTLVDTHPSAFEDRDFESFYAQTVADTEAIISLGESLGKKYYSLTPSHIPALEKRRVRD